MALERLQMNRLLEGHIWLAQGLWEIVYVTQVLPRPPVLLSCSTQLGASGDNAVSHT